MTSWAFTGLVAATLRAGRVVEKERRGWRRVLEGATFARDFLNIVTARKDKEAVSGWVTTRECMISHAWLPSSHSHRLNNFKIMSSIILHVYLSTPSGSCCTDIWFRTPGDASLPTAVRFAGTDHCGGVTLPLSDALWKGLLADTRTGGRGKVVREMIGVPNDPERPCSGAADTARTAFDEMNPRSDSSTLGGTEVFSVNRRLS